MNDATAARRLYIGSRHLEDFARRLAGNECLMLSPQESSLLLRANMFGESSGLAYLCQQVELPDGECLADRSRGCRQYR